MIGSAVENRSISPAPLSARAGKRSALLASLVFCALSAASASAVAAESASAQGQQFDVPAGPLDAALQSFAAQARVMLSADANLTAGKLSPGLRGNFTAAQGFDALLAGTGLEAVAENGSYSIRALSPQQRSTADARDKSPQLRKIKVAADADLTTEGTGSYTSQALTLGKTAQSLREIPQSVSVITRQRIEDQNLTTLDQALSQTTGINVTDNSQVNPRIMARGFFIRSIQRDGVPLERAGGFTSAPDLALYDRVEVLRGAAGLFSGSGQPGGAVNLVRKRALVEPQFSTTASAGSWNNNRIEADVTGAINHAGTFRGRMVAAYQDREYFQDVASSENTLVYGRGEYDFTPNTTLAFGGVFEQRDIVPDVNGLPRYSDGSDLHLRRSTFLGAAWNRWDVESPELFAELEHSWGTDWRVKLSATRLREDRDQKTTGVSGAVDPETLLGPTVRRNGVFASTLDGVQEGADVMVSGGFDLFGRRHELVVGANYLERTEDSRFAFVPGTVEDADVFNFDPYSYPEPADPAWAGGSRTTTRQSGMYASLRLHPIERLTVAAGARVSNWHEQQKSPAGESLTDYEVNDEVTPYGGLVYDLNEQWSLYASYADVFEVQNAYTSRGSLLPPIVGANYEAGVKSIWWDGALNASLAIFRINQTNRALEDPRNPYPCVGSPTGSCSIAQGEVRSEGAELEISGQVLPDLEMVAGYTYNTTKYVKDRTDTGAPSANEGEPFATDTPKHMFRVWANYRLPVLSKRLTVGTGVNAQSSQYSALLIRQGGYTLWDARVGYDINDNWTVSLNGNNLLDKVYYKNLSGYTESDHRYGEPRNFMFSVRTSFK